MSTDTRAVKNDEQAIAELQDTVEEYLNGFYPPAKVADYLYPAGTLLRQYDAQAFALECKLYSGGYYIAEEGKENSDE